MTLNHGVSRKYTASYKYGCGRCGLHFSSTQHLASHKELSSCNPNMVWPPNAHGTSGLKCISKQEYVTAVAMAAAQGTPSAQQPAVTTPGIGAAATKTGAMTAASCTLGCSATAESKKGSNRYIYQLKKQCSSSSLLHTNTVYYHYSAFPPAVYLPHPYITDPPTPSSHSNSTCSEALPQLHRGTAGGSSTSAGAAKQQQASMGSAGGSGGGSGRDRGRKRSASFADLGGGPAQSTGTKSSSSAAAGGAGGVGGADCGQGRSLRPAVNVKIGGPADVHNPRWKEASLIVPEGE